MEQLIKTTQELENKFYATVAFPIKTWTEQIEVQSDSNPHKNNKLPSLNRDSIAAKPGCDLVCNFNIPIHLS